MQQGNETATHMAQRGIVVLVALLALFPNLSYAITVDSYSRTPSGASVEAPPGLQVDLELSGGTVGTYACIYANSFPGVANPFPGSHEFLGSALTLSETYAAIPVASYYEVGVAIYADSACTSYISATTLEYDGGAEIFAVTAAPEPPPPPSGHATSSPDSYPTILFNGFLIFMIGVAVPIYASRIFDQNGF